MDDELGVLGGLVVLGCNCVSGIGTVGVSPWREERCDDVSGAHLTRVLRADAGAPSGAPSDLSAQSSLPGTEQRAGRVAGDSFLLPTWPSSWKVGGRLCFSTCFSFLILTVKQFKVWAGLTASRAHQVRP